MSQRRARIPDAQWERHKKVIQEYYVKQGKKLEGEGGLIDIMNQNHGFVAR